MISMFLTKFCFVRRVKRWLLISLLLFVVLFALTQIRLDLDDNSFYRKVKLVKGGWLERRYLGSWLQNKLLSYKWESYVDSYCKKGKSLALGKSYTMEEYLRYVASVGPLLDFHDGQSIFDNGCGCGASLSAFNLTYKDVKVGGLDLSTGAIAFAQEIFPKDRNNFQVGTVEDLSFVAHASYDHAMTFFTFPYVSPKKQCKAVQEMLRIVKPGGSIYIGHNLETDCKDKTHIGIYTLPLCFWNEQCLLGRDDIQEIYYIKEKDLFGVVKYCPEKSAVFVHKKGGLPSRKILSHIHQFQCDSRYPSGKKHD